MTLDSVRPESAFATDPDLAAAWRQRPGDDYSADIATLLSVHPWQRLNYRYGRWQSEGSALASMLTLTIWEGYHWETDDRSFQVLDPHTGRPLGEMYRRKDVLAMPGGALEFAGDPASIGAYRPLGGGLDTISLGWCWFLNLAVLRQGVAALRAGADRLPPAYKKVDLEVNDRFREWFVDSPDKPGRRAPNSTAARVYRP
jgi:hypothetical protein